MPVAGVAITLRLQNGFTVIARPNDYGRLGVIEIAAIHADSYTHAEILATNTVSWVLSHWSVILDVPLRTREVAITELSSGNSQITKALPAPIVAVPVGTSSPFDAEFRFYASLYREGQNTASMAYKFLCFYKIVEGLLSRRQNAAHLFRVRGLNVPSKDETLPATKAECLNWLNQRFPQVGQWLNEDLEQIFPQQCRGESVQETFKTYLHPVRVQIAHALLDGGATGFFPDDTQSLMSVHSWLWLAMAIAKWLIQDEFPDQFPQNQRPANP
jgi:hypothetical protein